MNSERWMKVAADMFSHPKFRSFCRKAGLDEDTGFAKLCRLWGWVQKIYPDGVITDADPEDIAQAMGYSGDVQTLMDALLHCGRRSGFLDRTESGELVCHQWFDYGGMLFERRFRDRQRKQTGREASKTEAKACEKGLTNPDYKKGVQTAQKPQNNGKAAPRPLPGPPQSLCDASLPEDGAPLPPFAENAAPSRAAGSPAVFAPPAKKPSAPRGEISAEFRADSSENSAAGPEIRAYTTQQNTTQNNKTENPLPPAPPASRGEAGEASAGKRQKNGGEAKRLFSAEFDALWQEYPRKLGKEQARRSYMRHRASGVTFEEIRDGLRRYVAYLRRRGTELRYCLNGATFFGPNCRWRDEEYQTPGVLCPQSYTPPPEEEQRAADRDFGGDLLACRKWNRRMAQ